MKIEVQGLGIIEIPEGWNKSQIKTYILALRPQEAAVELPKANNPDPLPPMPSKGTIEVEWLEKDAIVRGDLADLIPILHAECNMVWLNDWWHVVHEDVKTIGEICARNGYKFQELLPKSSPVVSSATSGHTAATGGGGRTGRSTPPAAEAIKGTIQHFTEKMTKGRDADPDKGIKAKPSQPFLSVLLKTSSGDRWYSLFDRDLIPFISKGKGKEGEFFVQSNGKFWNMVGIKRIGGQEFEENVPVIQQKTREAGGKTLYD